MVTLRDVVRRYVARSNILRIPVATRRLSALQWTVLKEAAKIEDSCVILDLDGVWGKVSERCVGGIEIQYSR